MLESTVIRRTRSNDELRKGQHSRVGKNEVNRRADLKSADEVDADAAAPVEIVDEFCDSGGIATADVEEKSLGAKTSSRRQNAGDDVRA
jgi:hypothetical protein